MTSLEIKSARPRAGHELRVRGARALGQARRLGLRLPRCARAGQYAGMPRHMERCTGVDSGGGGQRRGGRLRCLRRAPGLHGRAGRRALRGCARPWPAGEIARRPAVEPAGCRAGGAPRRALGRSSGIHRRGRSRGDGGGRYRGGAAAWRLLFPARAPASARRVPAAPARADGGGHRLQSRHLAADLDTAGHEPRRTGVRPEHQRVPARRHARGGAGAGPR